MSNYYVNGEMIVIRNSDISQVDLEQFQKIIKGWLPDYRYPDNCTIVFNLQKPTIYTLQIFNNIFCCFLIHKHGESPINDHVNSILNYVLTMIQLRFKSIRLANEYAAKIFIYLPSDINVISSLLERCGDQMLTILLDVKPHNHSEWRGEFKFNPDFTLMRKEPAHVQMRPFALNFGGDITQPQQAVQPAQPQFQQAMQPANFFGFDKNFMKK